MLDTILFYLTLYEQGKIGNIPLKLNVGYNI